MLQTDCRHFTGYKPCDLNPTCDATCPQRSVARLRLLIVHLGALGAVLRSTSLLAAMKRKFPGSHITWVTDAPAQALLAHNPLIDRVLTTRSADLLALSALRFDIAFGIDKSLTASGVLGQTRFEYLYGFAADEQSGAIRPATRAAEELWQIGLDNQRKFFVNKKTEQQLVHEALELGPYRRDPYLLNLTMSEKAQVVERQAGWRRPGEILLGLNTGCSGTIAYKKLTVEAHRELIQRILNKGPYRIVLLGGPEDQERNQRIAYGLDVVQSPTQLGLRDGIVSAQACDLIVSGDSLGMHLGIALQKWVVAWFGPTCAHEVDVYERGHMVQTGLACSPCWKRSCQNTVMCYDRAPLDDFLLGIEKGRQWLTTTSLSKPHLSATCSSPSL